MILEQDDPRLRFMPRADILKASGVVFVYRDFWWITHPAKGLVFYESDTKKKSITSAFPQRNSNKDVAEMLRGRMYPWAEVTFFSMVIVPIDIRDYSS